MFKQELKEDAKNGFLKKSITSLKKKTKQKNNPVQQKLGTKNNEKHFST